jgi:hypothetical protein
MQKKAIRLVCNSKYNAHTEHLFKKLSILPLPDLISYFNLQIIHRYNHNLLPTSFSNTWPTNERIIGNNMIQLRNFNALQTPVPIFKDFERLPLYSLPRTWENFNNDAIKASPSIRLFDENLKSFLLEKLSDVPNCRRLICPACIN